jgi:Protein of unknown function (DUF2892)
MSSLFPTNEGVADRLFRVVLGAGLYAPLALQGVSTWTGVGAAVGTVMLFTAAIGSCPLYTALGISTAAAKARA